MMLTRAERIGRGGFTLMEMMIVTAVLSVVSGILFTVGAGMARMAADQEALAVVRDDGRRAIQEICRSLRMAQSGTITDASDAPAALGYDPVTSLTFRRVADAAEEGQDETNGIALNRDMSVGTSPPITYCLDTDDLNGDGLSESQVIELIDGEFFKVIANHISPVYVDENNPNSIYNAPLGGLLFQDVGTGVLVTIITRKKAEATGIMLAERLDRVVRPRN